MSDENPFGGAILGVDHGAKFIGLALSHTGYFATPLMVIQRQSKAQDFARINAVIAKEHVVAIVLGLPPKPPHLQTAQADTVRNWARHLAKAVAPPIYLWDEGTSSMVAEDQLHQTGQRRPPRIDAHAAAVILQECLDALRGGHPLPPLLEEG